ncbi:MAG: polyprenyl synthetase family protein [candidate division Zixibacteria bacterium]|nr:polyprenyl synthetase family protein [candidate division Zixibacteria bacterium]
MNLENYLKRKRRIIEKALNGDLPSVKKRPVPLHRSMRYSVFAGGKRLRPILAIASFELVGGRGNAILPTACALELIHTYSLIHDDLPCMDDDDLRRGKPTLHKVFGDGMAVLAGDALHALAFELLSKTKNPKLTSEIAREIGTYGMVGGQAADLQAEGKKVTISQVNFIHSHKTSALMKASVRAGAILGGARGKRLKALTRYGEKFGLAFQIIDDILDATGKAEKLGKRTKADQSRAKATYPKILGVEKSKKIAGKLLEEAKAELKIFTGDGQILKELADYMIKRMD